MEPVDLYFASLGASLALTLVGILIVLRDTTMLAVLRWSCNGVSSGDNLGLRGAGASGPSGTTND